MTKLTSQQNDDNKLELKNPKYFTKRMKIFLRESLALIFWIYVILKLFIFDFDVYLIENYLPDYSWIINYKFFFIIGGLAIIWLFTKNKTIYLWLLYIIFYPLLKVLLILYKIIFIYQNWIVLLALINMVVNIFKSIKFNFIRFSLYAISVLIIFTSTRIYVLWFSTLLILALLIVTYINIFILVFKPSEIYIAYKKMIRWTKQKGTEIFKTDDIIKEADVTELDEIQLQKRITPLQIFVLFNRVCLFIAKKMKLYLKSGVNYFYNIGALFYIILLTILSFSFINFALYRVDKGYFEITGEISFITFIYYTINNLFFNSIQAIIPNHSVTQLVSIIGITFGMILALVVGYLFLTIRSKRYDEELNSTILEFKSQAEKMEDFIRDEYKINSISDAIVELEILKAGFIDAIYKLSELIEEE